MNKDATQLLQKEFGLQLPDTISEEELLNQLAIRIQNFFERSPIDFFQLMYRLDIPERKMETYLLGEDYAMRIAELVYQRQLQKIQSRKQNINRDSAIDDDIRW